MIWRVSDSWKNVDIRNIFLSVYYNCNYFWIYGVDPQIERHNPHHINISREAARRQNDILHIQSPAKQPNLVLATPRQWAR